MAVRQTRNTGLIITLIFFVFISITGIALAIVFYSQLNEAKIAAAGAQTELSKFVEPARRSSPEMNQYIAAGQKSEPPKAVVGYLEAELNRLKRDVAGSENVEVAQIETQLKAAGAAEGQSALDLIQQLKTDQENSRKEAAQLSEQIKAMQTQLAALEKVRDRINADAKAQSEQIAADIAKLQTDVAALDTSRQEALAALEDRVEKSRVANEEKRQTLEAQLRDSAKALDSAQKRLADLQGNIKKDSPLVPNPSTNVDGQVIGIPPNKDAVYIDLGRKHHLVLGLTFGVFDPARGVEVQEAEGGRVMRGAKAIIEVVSMTDNSAIARVVQSSFGQPIRVGDVIANLVYDKERTFKFYVFGNFNLDGVREPSLTDTEMVINLIEQWGGEVVKPDVRERQLAALGADAAKENILPYDTDFLIVGQEPRPPSSSADISDPAALRRAQLDRERLEQFRRLQQEANALGIPILNQNRFLALIGYYQR